MPRLKIPRVLRVFFQVNPYVTVDQTARTTELDGSGHETHIEFRAVGRASVTPVRTRAEFRSWRQRRFCPTTGVISFLLPNEMCIFN